MPSASADIMAAEASPSPIRKFNSPFDFVLTTFFYDNVCAINVLVFACRSERRAWGEVIPLLMENYLNSAFQVHA